MPHPVSLATKLYQRNKSMVCAGTPEKKKRKKKKHGEEKEDTQKRRKRKERKRSKRALRAQAESLGDKVAVGWYDQSCDMSSWTNIRTTQKKRKKKKKERKKKKKKEKRDQMEDKT